MPEQLWSTPRQKGKTRSDLSYVSTSRKYVYASDTMVLHVHIDRENREHLHRTHGQAELQRELQTEIDLLSKYEESSYNKKAHLPGARPFFQTPVFMSEDDPLLEKVPSITDASNQLWKVGIKEYEGRILSLLKEWAKDHTQWSAWISEQLHVDFNLPVALEDIFNTNVPDVHSVQTFVIGEGLPPIFLVVPYEDKKEQTSFRRYARECVRELISHLHDFCYVDFDVLPCFLDLKSLKKDTLEKEIKTQTQFSQLYFSGRRKLTPEGYKQIRDATAAIASVSYVPHVLRVPGDDTEQSREPDERIDDHERCPHCHEHYDDSHGRYAMILPCYHSLCYICTKSLSSKKDVSSKEDDIVYCPSCQEKQDKNRVQKNIYINQVVKRECIICKTNYHTQACKPKIMACYHHCCESCINRISTGFETFPCPLCRQSVSLESVKDNSYIIVQKPQRQLLLLDPEWRKVLSLMIEIFSFRDGDCHLKYTDTAEDKVRVAALEAARRWSLTRTVSFVTKDEWILESQSSLIHVTGKRPRPVHRLKCPTPGESADGSTTLQIVFAGRPPKNAPAAEGGSCEEELMDIKDEKFQDNADNNGEDCRTDTPQGLLPLPSTSKSLSGSSHRTSSSNWRQVVTSLYPDALTRTYVVPSVHFNRMPYVRGIVPGTSHTALVLHPPSGAAPVHNIPPVSQRPVPPSLYSLWTQESQPQAVLGLVQESDLREDFAQNHVMLNLQELGNSRHEAMFILSQVSFGDYLNQPAYAAAAAQLPRPSDLDTKQTKYSHGETDFVLIHRKHGILVGKIKSVGKNLACTQSPQPPADSSVAKRVAKAIKQLDRSETIVRHTVCDVAPGLSVMKTLFLPYVSTEQLERVLDNNPQLAQALCRNLYAANRADAIQLCCCSDQLSHPASYWHVTPAVLSQLSTWWQHLTAFTVDNLLTDDGYLDIVARFVGPATTFRVPCYDGLRVEVRTAGQTVAEMGRRLALLVLTLQQLDLMNRDPRLTCITGPPGTGKTVVLVLQGLRWLLQGHDVHVVSGDICTRAVSRMVKGQLGLSLSAESTPPPTPGAVLLHDYDFPNCDADVQQAATDLLTHVKDGRLNVLLPSAHFSSRTEAGQRYSTLVSRLTQNVPRLHLWSSNMFQEDIPPSLQSETFTIPLRLAPSVVREVQAARHSLPILEYNDSGLPAPGDGPRVIRLSHHGDAHRGRWPVECVQCGKEVAAELRRLDVGSGGRSLPNSPPPLSYRDVFVLTRSSELQDDVKDEAGRVTSRASGVVRGFRDEGLPVCVLGQQDRRNNRARWERDVHDIAVAATDRVTVADYQFVEGLERKIVALLPGRRESDDGLSEEDIDVEDRLYGVARCTTQLIMVRVPPRPAPAAAT